MISKIWETVIERYGVKLQSELDLSIGVREIIDRLRNSIPDINIGNCLNLTFDEPPLSYIYVNNKTIGSNGNLTALTECELTFYQNDNNTVRLKYFIQITHYSLIHGMSWVKSSKDISCDSYAINRVLDYIRDNFINKESDMNASVVKSTYGVWDGHGHRLGTMYNSVVRGFETSTLMSDKAIAKIVSLMHNAVIFFRTNQQVIDNIITKKI